MRKNRNFPLAEFWPACRRWTATLAFLASNLIAVLALSACDSGSSAPTGMPVGTPVARSGDTIFARYCNTCHPGGERGVGPSLIMKNYSVEEMKATVRHGKAQMPGFGASIISDEELDALVSYVQGMRH
jgi:mono/diheme cytochrome c family protein